MKIPFKWETIYKNSSTEIDNIDLRAKVFGGWLVKSVCVGSVCTGCVEKGKVLIEYDLIFIPDEKHEWEIDEE